MTKRQLQQYEMLVRVREFGAKHRARFPEPSVGGRAFATVADAVEQLGDDAVAQLALKRTGFRARAAARKALITSLESISRTARSIQADDPAFPNSFRLPERQTARMLLTTARLFVQDVGPVEQQFIDRGMPKSFVTKLKPAIAAYEEVVRRSEVDKGETAAARVSITATLDAALAGARRLDVIVGNLMAEDAAALADWAQVRRLPSLSRAAAPETPETPTDKPAAPDTPVTPDTTATLTAIAPAPKPPVTDVA